MEASASASRHLRAAVVQEAGQKALEYKAQGFHCSESVFLAVNDTLGITEPWVVKAVTGFHGGGGTHRLKPAADLTSAPPDGATGEQQADPAEIPVVKVQHLCGALAAGIACIGLIYGRCSPDADLTCADELCFELHRRFQEELGHNECKFVREIWVAHSEDGSCAPVYKRGAEIVVDILLNAREIAPECQPLTVESRGAVQGELGA